jgi:tyrosine-protein phosphatase SIW14
LIPNWLRCVLGMLIALLLIGGPLVYSRHRKEQSRSFHIVVEGTVYRSGQMSPSTLQRTIEEYGIKTIISFRHVRPERGTEEVLRKEEELCTKLGTRFIHIPTSSWSVDDEGIIPAQEPVDRFLKVMDDQSAYPVMIHCFAGMHRTGAFCAIYRMEFQRWTNQEAMRELKELGYKHLDDEQNVRSYLENYHPRWASHPQKID